MRVFAAIGQLAMVSAIVEEAAEVAIVPHPGDDDEDQADIQILVKQNIF